MFQKLLDRLEIRYGRYSGIRNLMTLIVFAMGAVYVIDLVMVPMMGFSLQSWLIFDREAILHGQLWRLVTFALIPPSSGVIFILIQLMFYIFLGNMLQSHWGTFRFNVFYFSGLLGSVIAGFITGYATSYYLNMSLFLAVAILYPDMQVNIYGILPVRLKWLALVDLLMILPTIITGTWAMRIAVLVSLGNVALFFYDRFVKTLQDAKRRREWRNAWKH